MWGHRTSAIMRYLLRLAAALTMLGSGTAGAQREVFALRGQISQDSPHSVQGTWFKEVEIVDVDGDGWFDIYANQKQPGVDFNDNIDLLYVSNGKANGGVVLGLDNLADVLAADLPRSATQPAAFAFKETRIAFPVAVRTSRGYDAEFADLNRDGLPDLIRPDRGTLFVLWGNGDRDFDGDGAKDGYFPVVTDLLTFEGNPNADCPAGGEDYFGRYDDVDLADFDGDGQADDFVVAQYDRCGRNFIVRNLTPRSKLADLVPSFSIEAIDEPDPTDEDELPAEGTHSVSAGLIDADAIADVVLAHLPQNRGETCRDQTPPEDVRPQIYRGQGGFSFALSATLDDPGLACLDTTVADLVDLDGDGDLDLYVAQAKREAPAEGSQHGAYYNTGSGAFRGFVAAPPVTFDGLLNGGGIYDARYADLDGDGRKEILVVSINVCEPTGTCSADAVFASGLRVFTVEASGAISEASSRFLPALVEGGIALDLADLDNDGDQDLVVGGVREDLPGPTTQFASAHIYENQTVTRLANRTVDRNAVFVGRESLTAGNLDITPGTSVVFETDAEFDGRPGIGGSILLREGFHAKAGSSFLAHTF